jgi:TonB family protein
MVWLRRQYGLSIKHLISQGCSMKKIMVLLFILVLACPCAGYSNTDAEKRQEMEKRIELLEKEVNKLRQDMASPRDDAESNYISGVLSLVRENWFFPEDLDVKSDDFVRVGLTIERDGTISAQEVVESSGNSQFNSYALEGLTKSTPLPSIPDEIDREFIELELRFRPPQN